MVGARPGRPARARRHPRRGLAGRARRVRRRRGHRVADRALRSARAARRPAGHARRRHAVPRRTAGCCSPRPAPGRASSTPRTPRCGRSTRRPSSSRTSPTCSSGGRTGPGAYGDHATHLLRDGDRWLVATSTWGDFDRRRPGATVRATLAETDADLLTGAHLLDTRPLDLPTTGLRSVGVWDPHLVRTDDGWLVGFVSATRFFRFHPALATGPTPRRAHPAGRRDRPDRDRGHHAGAPRRRLAGARQRRPRRAPRAARAVPGVRPRPARDRHRRRAVPHEHPVADARPRRRLVAAGRLQRAVVRRSAAGLRHARRPGFPAARGARLPCDAGHAPPLPCPPPAPHHPVADTRKQDHPCPTSSSSGSEHEQVVFANDPATGLKAVIAIHSTALGPALGGTRFHPYASTADAVRDVLNLSRGMSYKAALAGLDLGGGKAVIIGDPATLKSEALLRAYGRHVQSLDGRYYTACDVGTFSVDMDQIARECSFVTGRTVAHGGAGDSSVLTAYGVFQGMRAAATVTWGSHLARRPDRRRGRRRQGRPPPGPAPGRGRRLGGRHRRERRRRRAGPRRVPDRPGRARRPRRWSPRSSTSTRRARSAARSPTRSSRSLSARIICGAANNQLAHPGVEKALEERGILYAPDYCVNAGGLIQVADELEGFSFERAQQRATGIFDTTLHGLRAGRVRRRTAGHRRRPARRAPDARGRTAARDVARRALRSRTGFTGQPVKPARHAAATPACRAGFAGQPGKPATGRRASVAPRVGVVRPLLELFRLELVGVVARWTRRAARWPTPRSPSRECGTSGRGRPWSAWLSLGRAP